MSPRIAYIVTEDWAFLQHRLPMARAARAAGFEVHVLTRVGTRGGEIEAEGFVLHRLAWKRGSASPLAALVDAAAIRRILARIRPAVIHNVAVKPVVIGSLAALGLPGRPGVVSSIVGMGSAFLSSSLKARVLRGGLELSLRALLNRSRARTIVQNPDDRAALVKAGVQADRIVLIPGSGVDTEAHQPLAEPPSPPIVAAFTGRMLEDKGVRALVAAHRLLRAGGLDVELRLAGDTDPENPTAISRAELEAWAREPGLVWLGHVRDVREVWAGAHIAVLPSRREGLPKSLLEAAAHGRPMVATDAPGCREVALPGETGLLVPIDDAGALADAIARLAADPDLRRRYGANARRLAERRFSAADIGHQTVAVYRSVMMA